jgi:hypothetical protein
MKLLRNSCFSIVLLRARAVGDVYAGRKYQRPEFYEKALLISPTSLGDKIRRPKLLDKETSKRGRTTLFRHHGRIQNEERIIGRGAAADDRNSFQLQGTAAGLERGGPSP